MRPILLLCCIMCWSCSTNCTTAPTLTTITASEASCAVNNATCLNATIAPTTQAPAHKSKKKKKWQDVQLQPSYYKFKSSNRSDCFCDLQNRFCDINCCCDRDCALDAKQAFGFCKDASHLPAPNSKYCNYIQYIYNNRTLYEKEVRQSSLFCVIKSNVPAHYYEQKKKIILNPLHANVVIKDNPAFQWARTEQSLDEVSQNYTNHTAKFGDVIYILRNYAAAQKLELPASFITPDCITTKTVRYLQDFKTGCRQPLNDQNVRLFAHTYLKNFTALSSLRFLNNSLGNYEGCPRNVCVPFTIKQCSSKGSACWDMANDTQSACTAKLCTNLVTKVKYTFVHNGTYGIQGINVHLTLENLTTLATTHVHQEHEVMFLWTNQTELNYSDHRSGNPGYQIGAPILFGKLVIVVNTTTNVTTNQTTTQTRQFLNRSETNYIRNFLVFPKNVNGKCTLSAFVYESIPFGYNMLTRCEHSQGFVRKANTPANETCRLLQNNILAYWSLDVDAQLPRNTTSNATFGHFGNAQNRHLDAWGNFLFDVLPEELLNNTWGRNLSDANVECEHVSTGIKHHVFYERVQSEQNRIAAIYVEFVSLTTVELNAINGHVFSEVQLSSEVMFYDVTDVRNMKFVDPPSLNIKLPYDFFYPFIRVENHGSYTADVSSTSIVSLFSFSVLFLLR